MCDYKESDLRAEADRIVCEELANDAFDAVDMYTKDMDEYHDIVYRIGKLIKENDYIMNRLITRSLDQDLEEIEEAIDRVRAE